MNNTSQRFIFQEALNAIGAGRASAAIQLLGKGLPCSIVSISGYMVTVKIEVLSQYNMPQITVPVASSQYTKEPLQAGDKGFLIPCDANLDSVSGTGSVGDLSQPQNLSALVFKPIGNKQFTGYDPKIYYATGLTDVMLRDNTHQVQLEDLNTAFINLILDINAAFAIIGPLLTTPTTLVPIPATVNPVKPRA